MAQVEDPLTKPLPLRCKSCALSAPSRAAQCPFEAARYDAGAPVTTRDQVPGNVVYLRRGQVVLTNPRASGGERSCAVRGPGTILGLEAVLDRAVPYEIRALTDVAICVAGSGAVGAWLGPLDSPLGTTLRLSLEETSRRANERQVMEGTAVRRLAAFLLQMRTSASRDQAPSIPLAVLAEVLGMRPETLSRALSELRAEGALAPGRKIRILDEATLRLFAES
jgi:CRP-like cAMP-binding protein